MRSIFIKSVLFLSLLSIIPQLCAQEVLKIDFKPEESVVAMRYKYNQKPKDSLDAVNVLNALVRKFHTDGYLLASYSQFKWRDQPSANFSIGPQFEWLQLDFGNVEEVFIKKAGLKAKDFAKKLVRPDQLAKLEERLIVTAEERGFPFANLRYDSLSIKNNQIAATLNFNLGPEIEFDSVQVVNNRPLKSKFLSAYLGIRKGQPYDQSIINAAPRRLSRLTYVKLSDSPEVVYRNNEGQLKVALEKRPVNSIDGIIGFLPNNSRDNGLLVTGQFDLELHNPFFTGKYIGVHWRSLSEETQRIELDYEHPNIFSSPLSLNTNFNFLKQDTTFTRRDFSIDFGYNLGANARLTFISQFRNTDLLAPSLFQNANSLPEVADYSLTSYGLNFDFDLLDDPILPNQGLFVGFSGILGNKKILVNSDLPENLYDGVTLNTVQYQFDLSFDYYLPANQKLIFYSGIRAGTISNDRLFLNDAYRIGGLTTVRGFAESIFFATSYAYANLEARLLFDGQSFLRVFMDLGSTESDFVGDYSTDTLLGFGAGMSFATTSGIFNFVYALGTSEQTGPINFNQSKIHFGYSTRF